MTENTTPGASMFELYKLYLQTTEKVSDRRAQANTWMLSINSILVTLLALFDKVKEAIGDPGKQLWLVFIPSAGIIICVAWFALLVSYRKLNSAKFDVLMDMEKQMPYAIFTRENQLLKQQKRSNLSEIESSIPLAFGILYILLALIGLFL